MQDINQTLKVALVQADQIWENKEANLEHYEELLAPLSEVDLIVLPEMFNTGFSMSSTKLAEQMDCSAGLTWLHDLAKTKAAAVYTSLIIEEDGRYFNRGVFMAPEGLIRSYDKRKSFGLAGEDKHYSAGHDEVIVKHLGWNIQLQICYDLRFPEVSRNRIEPDGRAAYDLLLYVANWPEKRRAHWQTLLKARAIENQSYVVGVNRVGLDGGGLSYSGDSVCIDPLGGETLCTPAQEETRVVTLKYDRLLEVRESLPFLKDR
jgi:predicted amidohydrolase